MASSGQYDDDGSSRVTIVGTASGATDSGNPVKIGAVYNSTLPTATTGQRVDAQSDANGSILVLANGRQGTGIDSIANNSILTMGTNTLQSNAVRPLASSGFLFNGTTWDRVRGDTNGTYVGGNVASGATDVGNPVKTGAVYNTTGLAGLTTGQRGDLQMDSNGNLHVKVTGNSATGADGLANTLIYGTDTSRTTTRPIGQASHVFNGTTWDRMRNTGVSGGALLVENGPYLLGRVTADGQIKGSAGFIHTISVAPITATPTAGLLTVYNSLTETGTVVYSEWIFATGAGHTITLDIPCSTGIYVGFDATLANVQVTVSYR